ncbi:MAG: RluA family pseudouridine synthase [Proteobacteria bacterium]|nr:RluA family pseudouridine synthase [Pseudomonadota bacterium]
MKSTTYVIDSTREGQRIDNFLFTHLKGVPKSLIYRLLRTGKIRINGKRIRQTRRLVDKDTVTVPQLRTAPVRIPVIPEDLKSRIRSCILYEDTSVLAINKPAGIAVHPGHLAPFGVIEVLRATRPNAPFLELAHRLDRHTSGCLLIAKDKTMLDELHALFRDRKIEKQYLALVKGTWSQGTKKILVPLKKKADRATPSAAGERYQTAISHFSPLRIYAGVSLMKIRIHTGRTHQIRIHAAQAGHPVAGDPKYGDFAFNRVCRKDGLRRMFLHASKLSFQCRSTCVKYAIKAPLSPELNDFLECLSAPASRGVEKTGSPEPDPEHGT